MERHVRGTQTQVILAADSNYHSLDSLTVCRDKKLDAYIPDIRFRERAPRFAEQECFKDGLHGRQRPEKKAALFSLADFSFDASRQVYLCPNGKELTCHARNPVNRHRTYDVYHAHPEDCVACPLRGRCLSTEGTSRRYLSVQTGEQPPNLMDEMKTKMDGEAGKRVYARRLAIVEPVFANICIHKRMNKFTLHTKRKVDVQ